MMNKVKYIIIACMLFVSAFVCGQQVKIEYTGTDSLWVSELYAFAWNKQVPLNFENGVAVYKVNRLLKFSVWYQNLVSLLYLWWERMKK